MVTSVTKGGTQKLPKSSCGAFFWWYQKFFDLTISGVENAFPEYFSKNLCPWSPCYPIQKLVFVLTPQPRGLLWHTFVAACRLVCLLLQNKLKAQIIDLVTSENIPEK
jgi:hypothetical protein